MNEADKYTYLNVGLRYVTVCDSEPIMFAVVYVRS